MAETGPAQQKIGWAARPRAPFKAKGKGKGKAVIRASADGGDPFDDGNPADALGGIGRFSDYETPYRAQSVSSQEVAAFWPPMRSGDFASSIRRDLTLGRIQDTVRNDAHASSAIDKLCDHIVGAGLRWSAQPDAAALGIDRGVAQEFGKSLEREFRLFGSAHDPRRFCDASARLSLNGLFRLYCRTWLTIGEAAYALTLHDRPGARYQTALLSIDPDRICNPYGERDTATRRMGVEMTLLGEPTGYWVREAHLGDYWDPSRQMSWAFVPRSSDYGRPVFVHGFEPMREGDTRGTSPLIALIGKLRMLGKFADNELASATINALFAATIESDEPSDEVAERLTPAQVVRAGPQQFADTLSYYQSFPVKVGGARIPVLLPGSALKFNSSPRQTSSFPAFETAFLQTISSKLGLAYEQLKMDWSRTNYSSARAALNEVWRGVNRMRAAFVEQIVAPAQLAWADEAFDRGYVVEPPGAPKFWDCPSAYLRGQWIGPARGYIDPVKEIQAAALRIDGRMSTWRKECAEQGDDYEETFDQLEVETEMLKDRDLGDMPLTSAINRSQTADETADEVARAKPGKQEARDGA